ncbi:hypothetical protein ACFQJD_04260 [Haloplanus sp. GCM10025708]|uniref:hypothetical protein n=1 Tax=Haloferacaceae TaxID=1644056 RepID=UPI00361274BF
MEFGLLVRWLVVYAALFAVGLPVAARLLAPLATRGVGFALPVSLVVLTTGAYWVGRVTFGPLALVAGGSLLLAVAAVAALDWGRSRTGNSRSHPPSARSTGADSPRRRPSFSPASCWSSPSGRSIRRCSHSAARSSSTSAC